MSVDYSLECNKDSCCEHITGGVTIYLHGCVSENLKKGGYIVGSIGGSSQNRGGGVKTPLPTMLTDDSTFFQ